MCFKEYLKENLIKQDELAKELNVTQSLISLWCSGKCKPSLPLFIKLSKYLKLSLDKTVELFNKKE